MKSFTQRIYEFSKTHDSYDLYQEIQNSWEYGGQELKIQLNYSRAEQLLFWELMSKRFRIINANITILTLHFAPETLKYLPADCLDLTHTAVQVKDVADHILSGYKVKLAGGTFSRLLHSAYETKDFTLLNNFLLKKPPSKENAFKYLAMLLQMVKNQEDWKFFECLEKDLHPKIFNLFLLSIKIVGSLRDSWDELQAMVMEYEIPDTIESKLLEILRSCQKPHVTIVRKDLEGRETGKIVISYLLACEIPPIFQALDADYVEKRNHRVDFKCSEEAWNAVIAFADKNELPHNMDVALLVELEQLQEMYFWDELKCALTPHIRYLGLNSLIEYEEEPTILERLKVLTQQPLPGRIGSILTNEYRNILRGLKINDLPPGVSLKKLFKQISAPPIPRIPLRIDCKKLHSNFIHELTELEKLTSPVALKFIGLEEQDSGHLLTSKFDAIISHFPNLTKVKLEGSKEVILRVIDRFKQSRNENTQNFWSRYNLEVEETHAIFTPAAG